MYDGGRGGVLTAKQMRGYLERVLRKSENWTVYGTALLEHAWLECECNHRRERDILQIQALDNQYTHRLTLTQSTFESAVYTSAPPRERLRRIHSVVYLPPLFRGTKGSGGTVHDHGGVIVRGRPVQESRALG